jgi:branched-chain amino acid transport system ATP-binding protein
VRARLDAATGGAAVGPLLVLFLLNLVDEFDRIAFGTLTPEIRDAFDLSDGAIVAVGSVAAVVALVGALPIGVLADRRDRTRLVRWAGFGWAAMAVLTGVAPVLAVLVVARIGAGLAHITGEPLHSSLLGDYYEPVRHPRVFGIHRLANPIAAAIAVPIGLAATVWGWRPTFLLLAAPTAVLAVAAGRLREPRRGESIDAELAALVADDDPVPFAEARRQLFAVNTLRRLWFASFFLGLAIIPIGQFLSLFFEDEYGFSATQRGAVSFVLGSASIVGLLVGERWATAAALADRIERLPVLIGASISLFGAGMLAMVVSPWAPLSLVLAGVGIIGLGSFQPSYYALIGIVAPPRVRAQSYSWALTITGLGGLLSSVFAVIGDNSGYRVAIGLMATLIVAFGGVQASARRFVRDDARRAAETLAAVLEVRSMGADDGNRPLLLCRGVEVAYDQVQVLFGVDLVVRPGEVVALLGTNGAGKSTLLNAVAGLVEPVGGVVLFNGRDITHADANECARLGMVVVPGGKAVFPTLSVEEHLRAAGWLHRDDPEHLRAATADVLATFPRLRERLDQPAGNLSGGEQQMLALGMAFIARPTLLMIDELSLGLSPAIVEQLLAIVRRIQANGTAVVIVEQSINVALTIAERAYFLEKGEVRFEGLTADLLERDDIVRSVFLAGAAATSGATPARRHAPPVDARAVLDVQSLTKRFGGITAVDDASFTLHAGETLGLIGPNGAGKTTIFDIVSGFLGADTGSIHLDGVDITRWSAERRALAGLGRSFQDARLVPSLSVAENIALGLDRHITLRDHLGSFVHLPAIADIEDDVAWSVHDLIDLMGLGAFRDKFVRELSTGTRRVVDLAMCIAHQPAVLLLDEPSSGIAQRETEALGPLLERIQAEMGCALLVIEHDMPLISSVSDRLIALELGHPIAVGTPDAVLEDPRVVTSYLGGDVAGVAVTRSGQRTPHRRAPLRALAGSRR